MSYELRDQQLKRDEEYQTLKSLKANIETQVGNWMDKATALHTDSPLQTDKDEIIAQRDAFVLALRTSSRSNCS